MKQPAFQISPAGRLDLLLARGYLVERASPEVADEVLATIENAFGKLARTPGIGHRRRDLTDRDVLFFRVGSYLIIYRADKKPLHILRIFHASRDVKSLLSE